MNESIMEKMKKRWGWEGKESKKRGWGGEEKRREER